MGAQVLAVVMYLVLLRPDPLVLATRLARTAAAGEGAPVAGPDRPVTARVAIAAIAGAHGVMVAVMAMTPVHLLHHGATLTVVGLTFGGLVTGAVVTETIFNIPGIGSLLVNSIERRDYPVIQGVVLFATLMYLGVNLVVDLLYGLVDPRIRLATSR